VAAAASARSVAHLTGKSRKEDGREEEKEEEEEEEEG